jgi:hypothetical protein
VQEYISEISKMALALTSGQMAKDEAVKEHGVGEELAVHFMGWTGDNLGIICQMGEALSKSSKEDRFAASMNLCSILKQYWWVTALTMVSEGYCSLDRAATEDQDLATAFTDPSKPVVECLTVMHAQMDDGGRVSPVSMVAAPYRIGVGRNVMWNDILVYPEKADSHIKNAKYPTMLRRALMVQPVEEVTSAHLVQVRDEINEIGFLMQEFFDV